MPQTTKKSALAEELIALLEQKKYSDLTLKAIWARTHGEMEALAQFYEVAKDDMELQKVPSGPGILAMANQEKDMQYFVEERMKDKYL